MIVEGPTKNNVYAIDKTMKIHQPSIDWARLLVELMKPNDLNANMVFKLFLAFLFNNQLTQLSGDNHEKT